MDCRLPGSVRYFCPRGEQGITKSNKDCTRSDGGQSRDLGLPHSRQMRTARNARLGPLVKPDVLGSNLEGTPSAVANEMLNFELPLSIVLGVGLAAATSFRVFLPMLI